METTPVEELPPVDYPVLTAAHLTTRPSRRRRLPLILFVITCLSTFWAGAMKWSPTSIAMVDSIEARRIVLENWREGLIYMGCVLAILACHEMGHFIATVLCRIPASFPYFIPFPFSPIGTMGAVIGMAGQRADRKQTFDIGIAGPLAGLVVAMPILWMGLRQLDLSILPGGAYQMDCPWCVQLMLPWVRPDIQSLDTIWISQVNPYFMAAWVGLLITGLNMMPVSQLDGGHVIYALFLKKGHWIARIFLLVAIAYVTLARVGIWSVMLVIVILIGADHPPTANDDMPLGLFRTVLGYVSLLIPLLFFPLGGIILKY